MQNRVGIKRFQEREARDALAKLVNLKKKLSRYTCELTFDERRRQLRPRPGWEKIALMVAATSERTGFVHPIGSQDIRNDLELIENLLPVLSEAQLFVAILEDTIMRAQHEGWYGMTAHYTALQRLAGTDRAIAVALAPVREFFALGPRSQANDEGPEVGSDVVEDVVVDRGPEPSREPPAPAPVATPEPPTATETETSGNADTTEVP